MTMPGLTPRGGDQPLPPIGNPSSESIREPAVETPHIFVVSERCVGCQECIIRCPTGALDLDAVEWKAVGDDALCVGCRQCERTCPFGAIEIAGPLLLAPRATVPHRPVAISDLPGNITSTRPGLTYADAMQEAQRCLLCPDPTCVLGCPAHNDIPGFISAITESNFAEAHAVLRKTSVLPDICSIVCDQSIQCEGACSWKLAGGEPVAIGMLERFVTEQRPVPGVTLTAPSSSAPKVAVVGSGPAGMAAAWQLLEGGARVGMFEREDVTGGVLAWGIPEFTLPEKLARRPMAALERAGLEVHTGAAMDDASLAQLRGEYEAVILAQGASNPAPLPVPGADAKGVEDATHFLRRARLALSTGQGPLRDPPAGTRLLVVGAGNTAMDVARSARRLGCEVTAIDWFDRRFAAVREDELVEAEGEGVRIAFNRMVERFDVDGDGHVIAAELLETRQARAQLMPRPVASKRERLAVGHVVLATGYRVGGPFPADLERHLPRRAPNPEDTVADRTLIGSGLPAGDRRLTGLVRRRAFFEERAGEPVAASVWAAGDSLAGPSTVVGSMAQGMLVASKVLRSINHYREATHATAAREHGSTAVTSQVGDDVSQPSPALRSSRWLPKTVLAVGLVLELSGVVLVATTRLWLPAVIAFGTGTVGGLAGLHGWVGGWVRSQEGRQYDSR